MIYNHKIVILSVTLFIFLKLKIKQREHELIPKLNKIIYNLQI